MLRKVSRDWGIAPARILPENLPLAAFLHGDHPFGFESPAKPFLNEKNPQASQLTDFSGGKRGIRTTALIFLCEIICFYRENTCLKLNKLCNMQTIMQIEK